MTAREQGQRGPRPHATAHALALIAFLHVTWAHGSCMPFRNRARLYDAVLGGPGNRPSPIACYTVAIALATGSNAVRRASSSRHRLSRHLARGVALTLATRAIIGFTGSTHHFEHGVTSNTFRRLDRRIYSPLCMALAIGAARATRNAPPN